MTIVRATEDTKSMADDEWETLNHEAGYKGLVAGLRLETGARSTPDCVGLDLSHRHLSVRDNGKAICFEHQDGEWLKRGNWHRIVLPYPLILNLAAHVQRRRVLVLDDMDTFHLTRVLNDAVRDGSASQRVRARSMLKQLNGAIKSPGAEE